MDRDDERWRNVARRPTVRPPHDRLRDERGAGGEDQQDDEE
jgi:hypothetical protein